MGFLDPYAIDGATATAAQQRRENYKSAKGVTGIDHATDLRVVAVDGSPGVAGIMPGGGSVCVESRREAYNVTNLSMDGNALIDVPPAGSSGATHYIVVSVTDPEYHGQTPATVPQLVSSLSGRTRPYLPLARIDLEAGESFDATSSITDLRRMSVPLRERHLFAWNVESGVEHYRINETRWEGQGFPNFLTEPGYYPWWVDVPEWATHATMVGSWQGVLVRPVSGRWGRIWARLGYAQVNEDYIGHAQTRTVDWNLDDATNPIGVQREFWSVGDHVPVPQALRGQRQPLMLRGLRMATGESIGSSGVYLNAWSSVTFDIEFHESPG